MTRTGKSPRLSAHVDEPFVEIHAEDAAASGLADRTLARVSTPHGSVVLRVCCNDGQRRGELFAPIHWNGETASNARVGALVHPACDPHSGQPDMKATPAAIAPASFGIHGFLLCRTKPSLPDDFWWVRASVYGGFAVRFAADVPRQAWPSLARGLLGDDGAIIEFHDDKQEVYRAARVRGERLETCLYLAAGATTLPGLDWLKQQLTEETLGAGARRALLAGRPPEGIADAGLVICACFGVGLTAIQTLIASGAAVSVEAVGRHLKAGTNCGSCQPEIKKLIATINAARVLESAAS
jgi:assimilatory nitrate reductase catalytic subunit